MATIYVAPGDLYHTGQRPSFLGEWVAETDASWNPDVAVGQRVFHQGNIYEVITGHDINTGSTPPDSDTANWRLVEGTLEDPYKSSDLDEEVLSQLTDSDELILLDGAYNFFGFSRGQKNDAYPANGKPVLKSLNKHGAKIHSAKFAPANFLCLNLEVFNTYTVGGNSDNWPLGSRIGFHYSGCILHTGYFWPPLNCIVENCLIYANIATQGLFYGSWGQIKSGAVQQPEDKSIRFKGNTVIINTTASVTQKIFSGIINQGTMDPVFDRNIFYVASNPNSTSDWNFYSNGNFTNCVAYDSTGSATTTGLNDVTLLDPAFIDLNGGDVRLRPSSPLIGGASSNSKEALLEASNPNGKWFDSNAASGGDGSWAAPYNNYGEAINSFSGNEAVVLIKEGQHDLQQGYWGGASWSMNNDLPKAYPGGIKFIGTGSGSVLTSNTGVTSYSAFWAQADISNPNLRDTPFLFKDFDILLNNSAVINRGLIGARRAEYININVTQAPNLGAINSQLFDYMHQSGSNDSGEYLKMSGCAINVSQSTNNSNTNFLVGQNGGMKQFSGCTFTDLNRITSTSAQSPASFISSGFGSYPGSFIKGCIFYTKASNTTSFGGNGNTTLELKNNSVYSEVNSISIHASWENNGIVAVDPSFIATEPHDFDLRLRPSSLLIGGLKTEDSSGYYLQPGNTYNGDGSQKDASGMTTDGDPGPFNAFHKVNAAGVPYGADVVILNGTYPWQSELSGANHSTGKSNWEQQTYAGYNYKAETAGEVIFDGAKQQEYLLYRPIGGTPGDGSYLDLDTSFNGIVFQDVTSSGHASTRNLISTNAESAGQGSLVFNGCEFLRWTITSTSYPLTGGGRTQFGSVFKFHNCIISVATEGGGLFSGGDNFADNSYHGEWEYINNTIVVLAVGDTTFNGRNASVNSGGIYVKPNRLFGNYPVPGHTFKNNIVYAPGTDGSMALGHATNSSYLPNFSNNLFFGVEAGNHSSLISATNTTGVDPLFVDPASGNFSLRPLSPLIGQG